MLAEHEVEYLLIGGYAVGYHGFPRATGDMDIWVARHPRNAQRIVAALQAFGFGVPGLSADLFLEQNRIVRMGVPPFRLELTNQISGVQFEDCFRRRVTDQLDGVDVNLIGLDDLKRNKRASGRLKDLNDLENLP